MPRHLNTKIKKGFGEMELPPRLLEAVYMLDFDLVKECVEADPSCVGQLDSSKNNALHLCIAAGTFRTAEILRYLVSETSIDLLQKNTDHRNPFQLAIALDDVVAIEILELPTINSMCAQNPDNRGTLKPVQ